MAGDCLQEETPVQSLGPEDPQRSKWHPTAVFLPASVPPAENLVTTVHGVTGAGHDLVPKPPVSSTNMPIGTNND